MAHGVRAFTICLQGGLPGYEGAVNSAFVRMARCGTPTCAGSGGSSRRATASGAVVILGCYYQRQDQVLKDEAAVRAGVVNVAKWIEDSGFTNVVLEIANEFDHSGFDHRLLEDARRHRGADRPGQADLRRRCWCRPAVWAMGDWPTRSPGRAISC